MEHILSLSYGKDSLACLGAIEWDFDSPITFRADGHTVRDYDRRFQLEDQLLLPMDRSFRWEMLDSDLQKRMF